MCFTFFAAQGNPIGNSLFEPDQIETCAPLLDEHGDRSTCPPTSPAWAPAARSVTRPPAARSANFGRSLPDGWMGLDIGPGTAAEFGDIIGEARTVLWNGPMGVFEDPRFEAGTRSGGRGRGRQPGLHGHRRRRLAPRRSPSSAWPTGVDHISTGGGASLELIEQGDLPGLEALRSAPNA